MSASKSPTAGIRAQGQLKHVLAGMLARTYTAPEFAVAQAQQMFSAEGQLTDDETARKLQRFIGDFNAQIASPRL